MTRRLYYENAYLRAFDAEILATKLDGGGRCLARLDQSAFYPTSGGQPYDTGTLGGAQVTDVYADAAGEVWHALSAPLEACARVRGEIFWPRRFDHMQQHAGEHMLAGALYRLFQGHTIGLHLGGDASTIDVDFPDGKTRLAPEALALLEDDVNAHIQADVPIRCYFPDAQTLGALPLRKPPTVRENVRVVQIGEDEYCACGGTHPARAGEVGLFKIIDARPSKGKLRLTFLCGMRAFRDYRLRFQAANGAAAALSTSWEGLPAAVEALLRRAKDAEYHLNAALRESALASVPDMLAQASRAGEARVAKGYFPRLGAQGLRDVAGAVTQTPGYIALLACDSPGGGCLLVFARAQDARTDMGALMGEIARRHGGKGGGRADFAQGSAESALALDDAFTQIQCAFDK